MIQILHPIRHSSSLQAPRLRDMMVKMILSTRRRVQFGLHLRKSFRRQTNPEAKTL